MHRTFLASLLAAALVSSPVLAAPELWEVRDDDSAVWLFGSFHILPEGTAWRTELFDIVLRDADSVVFEADVRPAAQMNLTAEALARGIYTDGTLLTKMLDEGTTEQLHDVTDELGIGFGIIAAMRPWFAANTLSVAGIMAAGYSGEGVEFVLQPELDDERIGFLETGMEQLDLLANAPPEEQLAFLQSTLEEMPKLPKMLSKLLRHWTEGTPEELAALFLGEGGGFEDEFLERLIYARNRNWIPQLEARLATNDQSLIVVGAAHLVGEGSVLDLLEKAGYEVVQIQ